MFQSFSFFCDSNCVCVCLRKGCEGGFNNGFAPNFTNFRHVSRLWMSPFRPEKIDLAPEIDYTRGKERESKLGDCLVLRSTFTNRRRRRCRRRSRSPVDEQSLLHGTAGRPGRWWPPLVQQGSVVHGRRGMLHVALELLQAHGLANVERRKLTGRGLR